MICTIAAERHQQRNHMTTSVAISRYASTLMAFMPDSACQYSGSTSIGGGVQQRRHPPPADIGNERRGNPYPRLLDSTNRSHTRHHSA